VEAEQLEHLLHLRDQAADLDVAPALPDLLDEAHEHAQTCRRDVGQLAAVDDESDPARVDLGLDGPLELRRGVGVDEPFEGQHGHLVRLPAIDANIERFRHRQSPSTVTIVYAQTGPCGPRLSEP
jgi:hypothetical protein